MTHFCPGALFAASRAAIRSTPKATYERLLAALSVGDNLEEGHFVERSWFSLFGGRSWRVKRTSLAVYTIAHAAPPAHAPCNRSALTTWWPPAMHCLCFSYSPAVSAAKRRGWRVARIDAAILRLKLRVATRCDRTITQSLPTPG